MTYLLSRDGEARLEYVFDRDGNLTGVTASGTGARGAVVEIRSRATGEALRTAITERGEYDVASLGVRIERIRMPRTGRTIPRLSAVVSLRWQ